MKISFCIVCMNRLSHLKKTLKRNILDNYLPSEVEFVLLDYNSSDGLSEWVESNMSDFIGKGILSYYHTLEPKAFNRGHSRNMVMRLANGDIVCNLDADNYLGKGFALHILTHFKTQENECFYTSDYSFSDAIGRVCVRKSMFMNVKGYNELLSGYGFEDLEFYNTLRKNGLRQIYISNKSYFRAIRHSHRKRIESESLYINHDSVYISYVNPSFSHYLILNKDNTAIIGGIINNSYNIDYTTIEEELDINDRCMSSRFRCILTDHSPGVVLWENPNAAKVILSDSAINLQRHKNNNLRIGNEIYYSLKGKVNTAYFFKVLSEALNYMTVQKHLASEEIRNKDGFGKGIVYKNFNYKEELNIE